MRNLATLLLLLATLAACGAIMVPSGKLTPITPPEPTPRFLPTYPLLPPAPVYEDPEPYTNLVIPVRPYGFRIKPLKAYIPSSLYTKQIYF